MVLSSSQKNCSCEYRKVLDENQDNEFNSREHQICPSFHTLNELFSVFNEAAVFPQTVRNLSTINPS